MSTPFTMLGDADAMVCEGDSCLVAVPLNGVPVVPTSELHNEPTADEAAAASARAVAAALDEGAAL